MSTAATADKQDFMAAGTPSEAFQLAAGLPSHPLTFAFNMVHTLLKGDAEENSAHCKSAKPFTT